ncbi:hypothetical protein [Methylobacterium oxalidis]|uniref:Uncharacterized protein n=1 Tax=Methylobacterium oxalidis TaxID=944322 RepID=A0ABQ6DPZ1_9HYPH|nr:hypothetical protein [Methylobacterium oxalidis]GJE33451.1 hypothetical protein LDDCCGHA_3651 [Methylobacterium oxalidis]GLS66202.1 hypothetical protein GCM10007888_45840 [Methylobacterium oxalidis]
MQQIETTIERLGPMAAATLRASAVDPFEALVAPGDVFRHPHDVLAYPNLSRAEKRAILASWASDARAVESCPTLRCLPGCRAEPVPLHAVLAALQALDGITAAGTADTALDRDVPQRSRRSPPLLTRREPPSSIPGQQALN